MRLLKRWDKYVHPIILLLLAGILRFFHLPRKSLWVDELGQVYVSSRGFPAIFEAVSYHISPPLDYLLLHLTLFLGDSEFWVRFNSAVFGITAILIFYYFVNDMFGREIAVISSGLLAFSRFHIHYSQEARMYSLFCLLTILTYYICWLYIERGKKRLFSVLLLTNLALIYTHYYGIFVIISQALIFLFYIPWNQGINDRFVIIREYGKVFLGFLLVGGLYLPWVNTLFIQIDRGYNRNILSTSGNFLTAINQYKKIIIRSSWSIWPFYETDFNRISQFIADKYQYFFNEPWPKFSFSPEELIFPVLAGTGLVIYTLLKKRYKSVLVVFVWMVTPLIMMIIIDGSWATRYFVFILPAYLLFISLGVIGVKELISRYFSDEMGIALKYILLTVMITVIISSLLDYFYNVTNDDWRSVGNFLEEKTNPDHEILVLGGNSEYLGYYYTGPGKIIDADHMYSEKADINSLGDFSRFVNQDHCTWIFISQHSNKLFGNVNGDYYLENLPAIREKLNANYELKSDVYSLGDHKIRDGELPGLYKSLTCGQ